MDEGDTELDGSPEETPAERRKRKQKEYDQRAYQKKKLQRAKTAGKVSQAEFERQQASLEAAGKTRRKAARKEITATQKRNASLEKAEKHLLELQESNAAWLSIKDYATLRGKQRGTVDLAARRGAFEARGGQVLVAEADAYWQILDEKRRAKETPVDVGESPIGDTDDLEAGFVVLQGGKKIPSLRDSQARKEFALANKHELQFHQEAGRLCESAQVERKQFELGRILRDLLMAIPDRVADEYAAETDGRVIRDAMLEQLRDAMHAASEADGSMLRDDEDEEVA